MGSGLSDEAAMRHALRLALRGTGRVSPNPRVGCVILKDGRFIAEGWHAEYGGPHAEVMALERATEDVRGATLVVTLEPCVHQGKTPPCTPRIIEGGIARVVIGMLDPNPQVNGRGVEQLCAAGIQVELGVLEADCFWLNRFFAKHVRTGMPYVVGKLAQSLDGCIALPDGESRWISSEESRRRVHALRAELDAVLVGKGTVFRDNPRLTVRKVPGRQPWRVVLDTHLQLPMMSFVFTDEYRDRTIVCCSAQAARQRKAETLREAGVQLLELPTDSDGRLHLPSLLRELSQRFQIASVLVEGGAGGDVGVPAAAAPGRAPPLLCPDRAGEGATSVRAAPGALHPGCTAVASAGGVAQWGGPPVHPAARAAATVPAAECRGNNGTGVRCDAQRLWGCFSGAVQRGALMPSAPRGIPPEVVRVLDSALTLLGMSRTDLWLPCDAVEPDAYRLPQVCAFFEQPLQLLPWLEEQRQLLLALRPSTLEQSARQWAELLTGTAPMLPTYEQRLSARELDSLLRFNLERRLGLIGATVLRQYLVPCIEAQRELLALRSRIPQLPLLAELADSLLMLSEESATASLFELKAQELWALERGAPVLHRCCIGGVGALACANAGAVAGNLGSR
jgi:diaminohydroxyphosphoribosylaminopyrimidine deaminase/5-amino-6-(5-phosphoribosylamino)uracil reductase